MIMSTSYRNAFIAAVLFHILIAVMLLVESTNKRPVLTAASQTQASPAQPLAVAEEEQAIKAVSLDSKQVMETVNRLKEERVQQQQAEENRQKALKQQAESARKQRIVEQQRVEKLKNEAAKLALAHKKQMQEEQRHLQQLAKQKEAEEQHLAEMKKQQQKEADKLAELKKKKADELERAEIAKQAKTKDDLAKKQQAAAQQAAVDAQNNARIAGVVDKYKALIINAISRQWILPENANSNLSSQFRIRLAPNGIVLEVSHTRSSGDPILDRSAQSAIYKASPLPVPSDPDTFNLFREISLTVRPENARG